MFAIVFVCLVFMSCWSGSYRSFKDRARVSYNCDKLIDTAFIHSTNLNYFIDTAFIKNDSLNITIEYTGGCKEHTFDLESNGVLLKSLPPKQPIHLIHRSEIDPCRALINEKLKFDIRRFKGTPSGTTIIILEHWNQHLSYSY